METKHKAFIRKFYALEFLSGLHFFSAVLLALFSDWAGYGPEKGLFISLVLQFWFVIWQIVMEIPTGIIADRFGRKHSVALGCVMITISTLVYGSVPHWAIFALGEFIFAVGAALISGADDALFYDTIKPEGKEEHDEARRIFGKIQSAGLVGILISAPLGSIMAYTLGTNVPMLLTSIPAFLAAIVAWSMSEPPRRKDDKKEKRDAIKLGFEGLRLLRSHPILIRWTLNSMCVATSAYFVIWLNQPQLKAMGIPTFYNGFAHASFVLSQIVISWFYTRLEKWVGSPKRMLSISAVLTAVPFMLIAIFPNLVTLFVLLIIGGGFGLTRAGFMNLWMNKHIEADNRATMNSCIAMYQRLARGILNPIVGFTAGYSLSSTLFVIGLIALLSFLFPLNGEEEKKKE